MRRCEGTGGPGEMDSAANVKLGFLGRWKSFRCAWPCWDPPALIHTLLAIALYVPLHHFLFSWAPLEKDSYFAPILAWQALKSKPLIIVPLLVLAALAYRVRWDIFSQHSRQLRVLAFAAALILAWNFAFYPYNLYLDQPHYLDRLLLLGFSLLVLLSPAFIPIFVFWTIVMGSQFAVPLVGYSWTDKIVVVRVLIVFAAFFLLRIAGLRRSHFLFPVTLSLIASHYFIPGVAKLKLGWLFENKVQHLLMSGYSNGWLHCLGEDRLVALAKFLEEGGLLLAAATLLIEVGAIAILFGKRLSVLLLSSFVVLHLAIFAASGIFFWKWILLDLTCLVLLLRLDNHSLGIIYSRQSIFLSLALILFSGFIFHPPRLAWYDTRLNDLFEWDAVGVSGTVYLVDESQMAPFDLIFAQGRFWYLTRDKMLVGTYGSTASLALATALGQIQSASEIELLESDLGAVRFNERRKADFEAFTRIFFRNMNAGKGKKAFWPSAPRHIWTWRCNDALYQGQEPITEVRGRHVRTFWDGKGVRRLSNKVILTVAVR